MSVVQVDDEEYLLPFELIDKANVIPACSILGLQLTMLCDAVVETRQL